MSIIKQINYDQFSKIIGVDQFLKFIDNPEAVCVLFITDWSFPSRQTVKRIKKFNFDKQRLGIVDVDLVDSIELCERYEVHCVPYCIVFKQKEKIHQFSKYRIETLNEIFQPLIKQYQETLKPLEQGAKIMCPGNHNLQITEFLDVLIYIEGYFYCNKCRKIEKVEQGKPIGHCGLCDYDVCHDCLIN